MSGSVLLSRVVMIVLALIVATISSVASAAQTGSIAMFEMRKENYYVDYNNGTGVWVEKDVLVRHDGFKLMRMGASREILLWPPEYHANKSERLDVEILVSAIL